MRHLLLILALILGPMQASAALLAEEGRVLAVTPAVMESGAAASHDHSAKALAPFHGAKAHNHSTGAKAPGHSHGGAGCVAACALAGVSPISAGGQVSPPRPVAVRDAPAPVRAPSPLDWPPPRKPPRV